MTDTDDIVTRLRAWECGAVYRPSLYDDAANEIERLQAKLDAMHKMWLEEKTIADAARHMVTLLNLDVGAQTDD